MKINVLGFGVMGRQIAALFQLLGHEVTVWTRSDGDHDATLKRAARLVGRGVPLNREGSCYFVKSITDLPAAPTMETLVEDLGVKRSAIAALTPGVELMTNTSSLPPSSISPTAVGVHFFNPVFAIKLIETCGELGEAASSLVKDLSALGFSVVQTKDNPGYVANAVLFGEISAAVRLLDSGYDVTTIEAVMRGLDRPNVLDLIDRIGVDTTEAILENLGYPASKSLIRARDSGILGAKNKTSLRSFLMV